MLPSSDPLLCDVALLYRQQHSWLTRWLRQRLNCSQSAADLAQDTFIRLLNKEQVPQLHAPRTFLAKVAQSVLCNHYRRQKLERAYLEALANLPEPVAPCEETLAVLREALEAVDALLAGLPAKVRHAFLLNRLEGLTHQQIADQMQVSLSSVERWVRRAVTHCYLAQLGAGT